MGGGAEELPGLVRRLAETFPEIWAAYGQLGDATAAAGPLDKRDIRLVKLALAIGAHRQGATHAHVRKALRAGLSPDELRHVALLAMTTLGWPHAMAALSWVDDVVDALPEQRAQGGE